MASDNRVRKINGDEGTGATNNEGIVWALCKSGTESCNTVICSTLKNTFLKLKITGVPFSL